MPVFKDQLGNNVKLIGTPRRIISLVPSQTEFLWDIGLRDELAGITKFCVHPPGLMRSKVRVGGTKKLNLERIASLQPDLIIGNKEENSQEDIIALRKEFPVWMSDIVTLEDAFHMMSSLGEICGRKDAAETLVQSIRHGLQEVRGKGGGKKVAYFIWKDPFMLAGGNTFIDSVLGFAGFDNVAAGFTRYPAFSVEEIAKLKPEFCFLSTEPYPFKKEDVCRISGEIPGAKTMLVDGEMLSWYGSRLLRLPAYVSRLCQEMEHV